MVLDISGLFKGESIIVQPETSGDGNLFSESSNCYFGTFDSEFFGIHSVFYLSNPFLPQNYNGVGLSPEVIIEGETDGFKYVGHNTNTNLVNSSEVGVFYTEEDLENTEWFSKKKDGYIVYPMAESASGECWDVGDGLKKIIWFSQPELEVINTTSNSATVRFGNLEQYISRDNYGAIAVTLENCGKYWEGYKQLSHASVEKSINFRSSIRSGNFILSGLPANTLFTLFFYKKTPADRYYYMGEVEINTCSEEKPDCLLDVQFINKDMGNGVECINYPKLSFDDWQRFCNDINLIRVHAGLDEVSFLSISEGSEMSVDVFNQAAAAICDIYEHEYLDVPFGLDNPKHTYQEIDEEYFENLVDAIVCIRDTLIW